MANRNFKVHKSIGNKQVWRWFVKNKFFGLPPLTEQEFGIFIRNYNDNLASSLLSGRDIIFPNRMGKIELRKYFTSIDFKDGKLKTNMPIDWKTTLALWDEDLESKNNKKLIRFNVKEVYKIQYTKLKACYNNKSYFTFSVSKRIKRALKDKINNKEIDAFLCNTQVLN